MRKTEKELKPSRGPHRSSAMLGFGKDSFYSKDVQTVLRENVKDEIFRLKAWHYADTMTKRCDDGFQLFSDEIRGRVRMEAWKRLGQCYDVAPKWTAQLFLAVEKFNGEKKRDWPTSRKVSYLSNLFDLLHSGNPLKLKPFMRWPHIAQQMKTVFQNTFTEAQLAIEFSREKDRRRKIHDRWEPFFAKIGDKIIA